MVAFARSVGAALLGVEARLVDIQVSLPGCGETGAFRIVGMGDQGSLTLDVSLSKWDEAVSISAPASYQVQPAS